MQSVMRRSLLFMLLGCTLLTNAEVAIADDVNTSDVNAKDVNTKEPKLERFTYLQREMGVLFKIVLYAPNEEKATNAATAAFERISKLNAIYSDYDPKSELMKLCQNATPDKSMKVSSELFEVLQQANQLSQQSDGAFDVTIGPVVQLWRTARRSKQFPGNQDLAAAKQRVGYQSLVLNKQQKTVQLKQPNMRLDLGGIAKGTAADEALRVLQQQGIRYAIVDGSGDIAFGDPPPDKKVWRVGIAPLKPNAPPTQFLLMTGNAVATSGDAWQFVEIDGKRYSHIIDPKTGVGLTHRSTVTVVASTCTQADSLASAVSVLSPQEAIKLIDNTPGAATYFIRIEKDQPKVYQSKRWKELTIETIDEKLNPLN